MAKRKTHKKKSRTSKKKSTGTMHAINTAIAGVKKGHKGATVRLKKAITRHTKASCRMRSK